MHKTTDDIKAYWDGKAEALQTDPSATMKDTILRTMEIEAIASRLGPDDVLLDVGSGNAWGSIQFAEKCREVVAADYSARMVEMATRAIAASNRPNIRAQTADVLELSIQVAPGFSAVSSVRCLINLPEEDQQYRGLSEMTAVLRSGGRLFLLEGIAEHWESLNGARVAAGLPAMQLDWHNRLFRRAQLEAALRGFGEILEVVDFGEYYFLSRVVHPLLVAPEAPAFDGTANRVARRIWQSGAARGRFADMSTLVLYVCRKH